MSNTSVKVSMGLQDLAAGIDRDIADLAGEKCGFILLVFAGGNVNYVSSDPDRKQAAKAMREIIDKWERGTPDTPAHRRN